MPRRSKRRSNAISAFVVPSSGEYLGVEDWSSSERRTVWYGMPEHEDYIHPLGGTYTRCRVEAFDGDGESLGYLPLPLRYAQAWVQLCYTVVYWTSVWKAWVAKLQSVGGQHDLVQHCVKNSAARLLKYLLVRRLIIDELMQHHMSKDECDQLDVFDEYIIRERFDWLWTDFGEIPRNKRKVLRLDPVDPSNTHLFGWKVPGLEIPREMLAPATSPAHTWVWGEINHFNFQATFDNDYQNLINYAETDCVQLTAEQVYDSGIAGLPDRWHEGHTPAVRFLTAEEDRAFAPRGELPSDDAERAPDNTKSAGNRREGPEESSKGDLGESGPHSGVSNDAAPAGTPDGVVDGTDTRAVVVALVNDKINIPRAHEQLQVLLGSRYNANLWGKLLDQVTCEPGGEPAMTIDQGFTFYGELEGRGGDSHAKSMEDYRRVTKAFL